MAKPLPWFINAGLRTLHAFLPFLARPDDDFAAAILEENEFDLYRRLDRRDRAHACQVTRRLLERMPDARPELLRAALLHDVGKAVRPYNPLHRVLVHLYTPARVPTGPLAGGLRGAWQVKRHHALYGAQLIREAGGDPLVARLVEDHHQPGNQPGAQLLRRLDEET